MTESLELVVGERRTFTFSTSTEMLHKPITVNLESEWLIPDSDEWMEALKDKTGKFRNDGICDAFLLSIKVKSGLKFKKTDGTIVEEPEMVKKSVLSFHELMGDLANTFVKKMVENRSKLKN